MVANRIAGSNEHLKTIVRCSQTSGHEGVKSEASRLLALLAKQGRSAGKLVLFLPSIEEGCEGESA